MSDQPNVQAAGGVATQRGINYQNRVAAALVAACLAETPAGMGLPTSPIRIIRCESGEPVGDILLELNDGALLFVEVKRAIRLSDKKFAELVQQLVRQFIACEQSLSSDSRPWRKPLRSGVDRLQIITSSESPVAVRKHLAACLERIGAAATPTDLLSLVKNNAEGEAFNLFKTLVTGAWNDLIGERPDEDQFVRFASLVRIGTADTNPNESDEARALGMIGTSILADNQYSSAGWSGLIDIAAQAAQTRQPLSRDALRIQFERLGFPLKSSPNFVKDIQAIKDYTRLTIESMGYLGELSVKGASIRIKRDVAAYLATVVARKSLLVIGEPGAGKSGVLHELATILTSNSDVLFVAADRINGPLQAELGLTNDIGEILRNWAGNGAGFVIIDALDAARGVSASTALRDLMRRIAKSTDSRWKVLASVRTYDLRYGQEIQQIFHVPFDEERLEKFQDRDFPFIRHVLIPRFDSSELDRIFDQSPDIALVYKAANPSFQDLLASPFNLRLVADLLSSNLSHGEISAIQTHMALLDQYWLHRVIKSASEGTARELTLHYLLEAMVAERALTISKTKAREAATRPQFDPLCQDGVIVEQTANLHGRNIVGFSHHLLFDYAASRLYISTDRQGFLKKLTEGRDLALFLRLSIELLFKEAWVQDRVEFWKILGEFASQPKVPSIARIIGPAVIPELAKSTSDLEPLLLDINNVDQSRRHVAEQWVIHSVGAVLASSAGLDAMLWSRFAERLTELTASPVLLAVAQSLVDRLISCIEGDQGPYEAAELLNRASVNILNRLLEQPSRDIWMVSRTVTNLMDVMYADPSGAVTALRRLITPEEIVLHGAEHGPWIARKIRKALNVDPDFVADFYKAIFGYEETSEAQTSISGSRILALHSNRGQDYRHIYWDLSQFFPNFAKRYPELAGEVVGLVINGYVERDHKIDDAPQFISFSVGGIEHRVKQDYSSIWDGSTVRDDVQTITSSYFRLLGELAIEPGSRQQAAVIALQLLVTAEYAMTLRRLLAVAVEHPEVFGEVVYCLLISPSALISYDLTTSIGEVLPAVFPLLSPEKRSEVEIAIESIPSYGDPEFLEGLERARNRLFGCLPVESVTRQETRRRIAEMNESENGPPPNRPRYRTSGPYTVPFSIVEEQRRRGIPVDEAANVALRELAEPISDFAGRYVNSIPTLEEVEQLYCPLSDLRHAVDIAEANGAHIESKNSTEATLVAGCAAAAKCAGLSCASPVGILVKDVLLAGLRSPIPEHHPEYDDQFDKHPSWGAPLQRIEAASGIGALLQNESCIDSELLESLQTILGDPVPAVRFQLPIKLLALHKNHLDVLWTLLRQIASSEKSTSIIGAALYGAVNPLCGKYRAESLEIVRIILDREDLRSDGGDAREWSLRIATGLWIWQGDEAAYRIIQPLIAGDGFDPQSASRCMRDIREPLKFDSDPPKETDENIRRRAFGLIETIVSSASERIKQLLNHPQPSLRDQAWSDEFQKMAVLVDFAGNQIYFSSDTFKEPGSVKTLSDSSKARFWRESKDAITRLSETAIPSVAHHLIEILQGFIPYDPNQVFHAIAQVVRSAQGWGYQYESMAVDLLVKVIENYLAEYPQSIQEDPRAREELVDILEVFVDVGWPAARRLSYRLEEIFR